MYFQNVVAGTGAGVEAEDGAEAVTEANKIVHFLLHKILFKLCGHIRINCDNFDLKVIIFS